MATELRPERNRATSERAKERETQVMSVLETEQHRAPALECCYRRPTRERLALAAQAQPEWNLANSETVAETEVQMTWSVETGQHWASAPECRYRRPPRERLAMATQTQPDWNPAYSETAAEREVQMTWSVEAEQHWVSVLECRYRRAQRERKPGQQIRQ
jgi:hypothetical protein